MNTILKLGIVIATFLASLVAHAESKSDKVYNLFSGKEGVTYISFSKSVIKPFEVFFDEESKKVIYKMEKVRFMHYNKEKGKLKISEVTERIVRVFDDPEYFTLDPNEFDFKNNNQDKEWDEVKMLGRGEKSKMNELHIIASDEDGCVIFSFYGDIKIEDVRSCTKFSRSTNINISID